MTDIKALRDLLAQTPNGWRMSGYYYGFGSTGLAGIDRILSAVGCAGKGYHHTERWADGPGDGTGYDHLRGDTYIEAIQNAADDAAAALRSLPALLDRLEAQERRVADLRSATQDLVLNVTEAMQTGGWVPTPLHESFFDALTAAYKALEDSNG